MNPLRDLEKFGFRVGWRTVLVGWEGPASHERQVNNHQVVEFAVERLDLAPESDDDILLLASVAEMETEEIDRLLRRLVSQEVSSFDLETRKWRFLFLRRLLEIVPEKPLHAWMSLAEFWHSFGFPADSPTIIRNFEVEPETERYTLKTREKLLIAHEDWLTAEHSAIATADCPASSHRDRL